MIKAFVFDLDGVIVDTAPLHFKAWKEEVAKIGINFTEEENAPLKGLPRLDTLIEILKLHKREKDFSDKELNEMSYRKNEAFKQMLETDISEKDILPGIKELIQKASANKIKLSLASSSHNAPVILTKVKLMDYFDFIVNPGDVKNGKPAPDIFIEACKGVDTSPSESLGFEDAVAGVHGLYDAKLKIVAITHGDKGDFSKADYIVTKTNELSFDDLMKRFNK